MGLFDTVKLKANALAADAERAGKVTAAQARTVVLQNDIRKAERELGHSAFALIEGDQIAHPDLEAAATRLRDARRALADKEAEIAGLRRGTEVGDEAGPAPAGETSAPPPEIVEEAARAKEPPAAEVAPPVKAAAETATKPAATRRSTAAKKSAPKKAVATKKTPKKPTAQKKPPVVKAPPADDA
jgi:ribonuclease E